MVKVFLLIVVGVIGTPEHESFRTWGATLASASERLGVPRDQLVYLVDQPGEGDPLVTGRSTRDEVTKALQTFAAQAGPDDLVFVLLVGHGTFANRTARFNLVGPDMTPADFDVLLRKLPSRQLVFVNAASASGPFLEELSGPGRTIVTATNSGAQQYATLFGGPFVDALTSDVADLDKNQRVTVLEAFQYAKTEVARAYEREGLLSTETAMLDDDGDKKGTQTPSSTAGDGRVAALVALGTIDTRGVPLDPALAALYAERRDLERQLENLRLLKDSMPAPRYASELERLAVEIARKTREIRAAEAN